MIYSTKTHKIINCILFLLLLFAVSLRLSSKDVDAASTYLGCAAYRDHVSLMGIEINDHAAIMDQANNTLYYPVVHAAGTGKVVKYGTWAEFLDDGEFICYCKPKNCSMTSSLRNSFRSKARELRGIPYTGLDQIQYIAFDDYIVKPKHITNLRCDGVVEYVYEYYGYRVGGPTGTWNVSINNYANLAAHSGSSITPRKQHKYLLTVVP